jgi:MFS transporter, ACS family, tartrate transporter
MRVNPCRSSTGLVCARLIIAAAVVGMTIATIGLDGSKGPFWTMPSTFLTGSAAASGIAWINGIGNLGGFFGPAVGWVKTATGSFSSGLYMLAGMAVVSAVSTFWLNMKNPVADRGLASAPAE